jgi:hypothetical protein
MKIEGRTDAREETNRKVAIVKMATKTVQQKLRLFATNVKNVFSFGDSPFFVSPARHGEAQDMSGT